MSAAVSSKFYSFKYVSPYPAFEQVNYFNSSYALMPLKLNLSGVSNHFY